MKKKFLSFLFLFSLFCCTNAQIKTKIITSDVEVITINPPKLDANKMDAFYSYSKKIDSKRVEYIVLETKPGALIGSIDKILFIDDKYFILDKNNSKAVFIFTKGGTFINKIQNHGKGPGEFTKIKDFRYNKFSGFLEIYALYRQKIIVYNTQGQYIKEISNPINFHQFYPVSKNVRYFYSKFIPNKEELKTNINYRLVKIDEKNNCSAMYLDFNDDLSLQLVIGLSNNFYSNSSKNYFLFCESYNNNIYEVADNDFVSIKYRLFFKNSNLEDNFITSKIRDKFSYVNEQKKSYLSEIVFENEEKLIFNYNNGGIIYNYEYDKINKTGNNFTVCFINDDNIYTRPSLSYFNDFSISIIEPYVFLKNSKADKSERIVNLLKTVEETNNPILVRINNSL